MIDLVRSFFMEESGATAIEYGLVAALVSLTVVGAGTLLGTTVQNTFTNVSSTLSNATSG
jgi:pilus assembly protein Flp/PilA